MSLTLVRVFFVTENVLPWVAEVLHRQPRSQALSSMRRRGNEVASPLVMWIARDVEG